ncbi:MAG: hypothetical protein AAF989_08720 [Planctomycetota bacterium]
MNHHASPSDDSAPPANWSLRGPGVLRDGLTEVELRQTLLQIPDENLEQFEVRQASSVWHSATRVLALYKRLARQGIYLRVDGLMQGPFTLQRGVELMMSWRDRLDELEVRRGLDGPWQSGIEFQQDLQRQAAADGAQVPTGNDQTVVPALPVSPTTATVNLPADVVVAVPYEPNPSNSHAPSVGSGTAGQPDVSAANAGSPIPAGTIPVAAPYQPPPSRPRSPQTRDINLDHVPAYVSSTRQTMPAYLAPQPHAATQTSSAARSGRSPQQRSVVPWLIGGGVIVTCILMMCGGLVALAVKGVSDNRAALKSADANPPRVSNGALFRPEFRTSMGEGGGGTMFAASLTQGDDPIFIGALHLLGEATGFPRNITGAEVPNVLQSIRLGDCVDQQDLGWFDGQTIPLRQAMVIPVTSLHGDVFAFQPRSTQVSLSRVSPWVLSTKRPRSGERVWLVSELIDAPGLIHPAKVIAEQDGWLYYEFDQRLNIRATSGAPVINSDHEVIAVNAGEGERLGRQLGVGTPVTKFRRALSDAKRLIP